MALPSVTVPCRTEKMAALQALGYAWERAQGERPLCHSFPAESEKGSRIHHLRSVSDVVTFKTDSLFQDFGLVKLVKWLD